jgi:hypothetical protein
MVILSKEDAPDPIPQVIRIGGECLQLIDQFSGDDPTATWNQVQAQYSTCPECETKECSTVWSVTYDCETGQWSEAIALSITCIDFCSETDWFLSSYDEVTQICTYEYLQCHNTCDEDADCNIPLSPPSPCSAGQPCDLGIELLSECGCFSSSSSSSSSSIPSSSSSSPSSSSSSLPSSSSSVQPVEDDRFV